MNLDREQKVTSAAHADKQAESRRELTRRLGKFALYAAPFTIVAASSKARASSAVGTGPGKHR